ncbi:MAG: sugar ABC transporter substrate-binding protein, partial [Candidatus Neomarinimicrobiota bacterium]
MAKYLVDNWNAVNDSVKVKLQPIPASQSSEEVLLAAIAAGTTPDICSNIWPGAMDDFIATGGLV